MDNIEESLNNFFYNSLVSHCSQENFLAPGEVEKLVKGFNEKIIKLSQVTGEYLIRNSQARLKNKTVLKNYEYKIISLGRDCLPRTVLTRWGIKPTKSEGELSYPFDLANHPTQVVISVLKNNFSNYLDPLRVKRKNEVLSFPWNPKIGIKFNHEFGKLFIKDNFSLLRKKYAERIQNFRNINRENAILFVHHLSRKLTNESFLEELVESICSSQGFNNSNHALLLINSNMHNFNQSSLTKDYEIKVFLLNIPYPYAKYIWWDPIHYSSKPGERFESKISEKTIKIITKHFDRKINEEFSCHNGD